MGRQRTIRGKTIEDRKGKRKNQRKQLARGMKKMMKETDMNRHHNNTARNT
jgi:hypothetical protein